MFAVLKTGGKQYKVAKDDVFTVEKLAAEAGETIQFNEILMLGGDKVTVGAPLVAGAGVQAEVIDQTKGAKVINFKKRRRKHSSQRKKGHRQQLTLIKVTDILASGADKSGVKAAVGAGSVAGVAIAAAAAAAKPAAKKKAAPKKEAKAEAPKPKAAPKPKKEEAAPAPEGGTEPANLLKAPKGDADDLKKISGVGPKLEGTLHEIGVFHFWQIAEWGKAEIDFMDDKLSFKGRIERDEWIKQAAEFAKESGK